MVFLLDADTLIRADRVYYPLMRFPVFWDWLQHNGNAGHVKIPVEQYEEVVVGNGVLVDWLKDEKNKAALLFDTEADPSLVAEVTENGYAPDLDEAEIAKLGRDPFLIAYGYELKQQRSVVTFEVSAPKKQRANRKIPDVCKALGVQCYTLFDLIETLDFRTDWKP